MDPIKALLAQYILAKFGTSSPRFGDVVIQIMSDLREMKALVPNE